MHTFRIGPTFIVNAKSKTANNRKESDMNNEENAAPPVILAIENTAEKEVEKWYRDHRQVRNVVLEFAKQHPNGKVARLARSLDLNSYPETYPAPPVLLSKSEEEE